MAPVKPAVTVLAQDGKAFGGAGLLAIVAAAGLILFAPGRGKPGGGGTTPAGLIEAVTVSQRALARREPLRKRPGELFAVTVAMRSDRHGTWSIVVRVLDKTGRQIDQDRSPWFGLPAGETTQRGFIFPASPTYDWNTSFTGRLDMVVEVHRVNDAIVGELADTLTLADAVEFRP